MRTRIHVREEADEVSKPSQAILQMARLSCDSVHHGRQSEGAEFDSSRTIMRPPLHREPVARGSMQTFNDERAHSTR